MILKTLQGEPMEMVETFEWTEGEVEREDEAPGIEDTISNSVLSGVKEVRFQIRRI